MAAPSVPATSSKPKEFTIKLTKEHINAFNRGTHLTVGLNDLLGKIDEEVPAAAIFLILKPVIDDLQFVQSKIPTDIEVVDS